MHERRAWVLLDERPRRAVGRALAWADGNGVTHTDLLVETAAGDVARIASHFATPPAVWQVDGNQLTPAEAAALPPVAEPPESALDLVVLLREAGLDIVIEHGEVRGEVLGLEVARVVEDGDGGSRIEVGVGRHDREAFALVHGDLPTTDALRTVVDSVRRHRSPAASGHPLGRLAAERWLRTVVIADPAVVGANHLEPAEPVVARDNIKDLAPAVAVGTTVDGRDLVVACSVGIDLDLVPAAADARARHAPAAELRLVVPARDDHPVTRRLASALRMPATVVGFERDFRSIDPTAGRRAG